MPDYHSTNRQRLKIRILLGSTLDQFFLFKPLRHARVRELRLYDLSHESIIMNRSILLWRPYALNNLGAHDANPSKLCLAFFFLYFLMALSCAVLTRIDAAARKGLDDHVLHQPDGLLPYTTPTAGKMNSGLEINHPNNAVSLSCPQLIYGRLELRTIQYSRLVDTMIPFIPSSLVSTYHNQLFLLALFVFLACASWAQPLQRWHIFRREIRYCTLSAVTIFSIISFSEIYDMRM